MKMAWRKGKTSGWAAFNREQRGKHVVEPEENSESFPSVLSSGDQIHNAFERTKNVLEKPFASVLQYPGKLLPSGNRRYIMKVGSPIVSEYVNEHNAVRGLLKPNDMLNELHPWADQSLIQDILAGVDNDVDKASTLLKMMVSSEQNYKESEVTENKEMKSNCKESLVHENKLSVDLGIDFTELSSHSNGPKDNNEEFADATASSSNMLMFDNLHTKAIPNSIKYDVPIEPEWEEDDVYLVHRKDARRMMRLASQHSKAASEAYRRVDHLSAQLYSRKAHEEWVIAEELNARAAKDILAIRNSTNDEWTLDLHGLHASEAVHALQAHLQKIESQVPAKQFDATSQIVLLAPSESANYTDVEKLGNRIPYYGARPTSLQVITGKGNHSRGEAAIPAAVRSFLIDNGYRSDESRPGVIEVKPKFRRG